ncbi:MAG: D-aminoacylase [Acidobacteriota bacterium]
MSRQVTRRRFLGASAAAASGLLVTRCGAHEHGEIDLAIMGGMVLDGTGAPGVIADVAVRGDRIVLVGQVDARRARRSIDAHGLCVAPGFIDIHTHSDNTIFEWPGADSRVRQGCTTEITGNCGSSAAPRQAGHRDEDDQGKPPTWTDVASYAAAWNSAAPALNQALLIGHGTLRRGLIGDLDRAATAEELAELSRRLERALDQGAIGLSTGLEYVPGIYTPPQEIEALVRIVARRGGLYASHMRNEEEHLLDAIDEILRTGQATGARVQVSHLKAAGKPNWGAQDEAIARIERARAGGLDVMADAYPYTAYSTTLTILLEPWSREGGAEAIVARLAQPEQRKRIVDEVRSRVVRDPGGFDLVVISSVSGQELQSCVGRNVVQIASTWGVTPEEAFARLLEGSRADVGYVGHGMSERNVERVLAHPLVMIGSDGRSMAPTGRALDDRPHPRSYGTFPRVLGYYCRERKLFDLPTAVRKMTALPAERAGLRDRGRIAAGLAADLVIFDSGRVADTATFDDPQRFPIGIEHVIVNGVAVVEKANTTQARPGRWLRRL